MTLQVQLISPRKVIQTRSGSFHAACVANVSARQDMLGYIYPECHARAFASNCSFSLRFSQLYGTNAFLTVICYGIYTIAETVGNAHAARQTVPDRYRQTGHHSPVRECRTEDLLAQRTRKHSNAAPQQLATDATDGHPNLHRVPGGKDVPQRSPASS